MQGFKWPRRPTSTATASLLGEDSFGRWLGIRKGATWSSEAFTRSGVFEHSFVKLVPAGTFWTACFQAVDPVVDVDIVLPVLWTGDALEETDLELDILRSADGTVYVRDQEEFDHVRLNMGIPDDISAQAEATCQRLRELLERRVEPFGEVGQEWLSRFSGTGG